ncbi:MAG: tetratricopeptide repeat protein [Acidobacteriota bacterium]
MRSLSVLTLFAVLVPAAADAARKARLVGTLKDLAGKPIPEVAVTVTSPQLQGFRKILSTDKKGSFVVDFSQIDVTYVYHFERPGFRTMEVKQEWRLEGTQMQEWTLQPQAAQTVGDAPPASTSEAAIAAYNAGLTAFQAKDYATAEGKLAEAVGHDPQLRQAWAVLSAAQVELGRNREAAEAAEKAIALGSMDEAVLLSRWQAYRNLGDEAKVAAALADLEKVGRSAEEAKRLHNEGVALAKAGDQAGAFAKYREALNLDPGLQASLFGLAAAALKIGRPAEAATAAETVLKDDPRNEQAIRLRFNACLELGDKGRLAEALVGLAPFEPVTARNGLLQLAFEAYDANDLTRAKDLFGQVLAVAPDYPQAHYYLGVILAGQGAGTEARQYLERFLQIAPNDPESGSAREMLKYLRP